MNKPWQTIVDQTVKLTPYTIGYTLGNDPSGIHTIYVTKVTIKEALSEAEFRISGIDTVYEILFVKKTYQ